MIFDLQIAELSHNLNFCSNVCFVLVQPPHQVCSYFKDPLVCIGTVAMDKIVSSAPALGLCGKIQSSLNFSLRGGEAKLYPFSDASTSCVLFVERGAIEKGAPETFLMRFVHTLLCYS